MSPDPLLTPGEHAALDITRMLAKAMAGIISDNHPLTRADWTDFSAHLHAIQHMIMAQAAARAYPHRYRLLGESPEPHSPCHGACANCQLQAGSCQGPEVVPCEGSGKHREAKAE